MSRFYGSMQGSRGETTRQGSPNSGLVAHLRGWNLGVRVELSVDAAGRDVVRVYRTGGSTNPAPTTKIVELVEQTANG